MVTSDSGSATLDGGSWGVLPPSETWRALSFDYSHRQVSTVILSWPLSEPSWRLQATTNRFATGTIS